MEKDNSTSVLIKLARLLKLKINTKSISEELEKHPDHPSLFAISDILNYWKVPNAAYQLEFQSLKDIPAPYI
ncbi:MAG TPA: hypothetical protein VF273_00930, partial [Pelobium sp.]